MELVTLVLVLLFAQQVVTQGPADDTIETSIRALAERVSEDSTIFSGDHVNMRCSVPDVHKSNWDYNWFKESVRLTQSGELLVLWRVRVKDSGKYYCQGERDSVVGKISTLQSLPVEINVDGGWAILDVPPHPGLVGTTLEVTCRVRDSPPLKETIFYKDGVEIHRARGHDPQLHLTNLILEDQGLYYCRASWEANHRTRSVISTGVPVQVLEVLTQPEVEILADDDLTPGKMMKLVCHLQYNAHAPAPPIHYYFYKNNLRLGTATSENHNLVRQTPGNYSCKAKVPQLGLTRWSEPKGFGQFPGTSK